MPNLASSSHSSTNNSTTQSSSIHRLHPMVLRSHKQAHTISVFTTEPTSFQTANQSLVWRQAMLDELTALYKNQTWTLVPKSPHMNIVGNKGVFRIKTHADSSLARYKARLVAKGFHQQPGIDYFETFSPVIKPTTIRLILSLAVTNQWPIRQLDVNNAFLNGFLTEPVYMQQPQGFIDAKHPDYVCKLQRSLYGLK